MQFEKLNAPSLKELFIQQLETMILSGKLPVGEKLPAERELAQTMQVSRAVINAGISELARKGFLTIKPRVGTFVADYRRNGTIDTLISIMNYNGGILRDDEIRSILELRLGLDALAVHLCIPKITDEELKTLKEKVNSLLIAKTPEEASVVAFSFQHEIACLSGNTLMPLIFSSFRSPVITLWERFCRLYGIQALYENTLNLYQCIEEGDLSKAIKWLNTSLNETIHGNRPIYY